MARRRLKRELLQPVNDGVSHGRRSVELVRDCTGVRVRCLRRAAFRYSSFPSPAFGTTRTSVEQQRTPFVGTNGCRPGAHRVAEADMRERIFAGECLALWRRHAIKYGLRHARLGEM